MKKILSAFFIFYSFIVAAQSSDEYLQSGIAKQNVKDYSGAIKDYDKAIRAYKNNRDAYFNRGNCELALKDYKAALEDFNKTLDIDPNFGNAMYNRAAIYTQEENYAAAIADLDRLLATDTGFHNVLTLRGQLRVKGGDMRGGCDDFYKAKARGDANADKYIMQFCRTGPVIEEYLQLDWPKSENWKPANTQDDGSMKVTEFIHADESLDNWTEFGSVMTIKGVKNLPMESVMEMMFEQARERSAKARITFIEKDESAEYPWIIFMIEAPSFKDSKKPESQLWYAVQGKQALYTSFRSVRQTSIRADQRIKWMEFFKTAKVVSN